MLQKDLEPKENKDQAADKLSFALVSASEEVSNNNSGDGDDHGCDPDDGDRFYDRSSEESKCDSDSECVNTGCDSENKHVFVVDRCVHDIDNFLFVPFPDCSIIILPPMKPSRMNAIQWSMLVIYFWNWLPRSQPTNGINA